MVDNPATARQGEPTPNSFVLADKLASCRFIYRDMLPPPILERWLPMWSKKELPTAIRVEMEPLDPGSASLHVMSVTIPIRVDKDPMKVYGD